MGLFQNDVSEYMTPRQWNPAKLILEFQSVEQGADRYTVTARLDGQEALSGQFIVKPEWRSPTAANQKFKQYVPEYHAKIGTQLFGALFSGALSRSWAQAVERGNKSDGLQIIIRSTSYDIHALPWELLSDPTLTINEYVVFVDNWSLLHDVTGPGLVEDSRISVVRPPLPESKLRILAMTTRLGGLDQSADPRIIRSAFPNATMQTIANSGSIQVIQALKSDSAEIAHFMGTGKPSKQGWQDLWVDESVDVTAGDVDQTKSLLRGRTLSANALADALEETSRLRLLVLAACETDLLAARLAEVVPAVIGIRGIISDHSCQTFLGGLYVALASGAPLSQAVASGRGQQVGFSSSLGDEWAQPVLFVRKDAAVVSRPNRSAEAEEDPVILQSEMKRTGPLDGSTQRLLDMKEADLNALLEQWGQSVGHVSVSLEDTPPFVQQEIERLRGDVERLRGAL